MHHRGWVLHLLSNLDRISSPNLGEHVSCFNVIILFFLLKKQSLLLGQVDIFLKYVQKHVANGPYSILTKIHHNDTSSYNIVFYFLFFVRLYVRTLCCIMSGNFSSFVIQTSYI